MAEIAQRRRAGTRPTGEDPPPRPGKRRISSPRENPESSGESAFRYLPKLLPPDDLNVSSDDSDKSPRRLLHLGQKRKDRDENNKERRPIAPATSRCFVLPERVICPVRTAWADFRFAVRGRQRRKGTYQNGRRKGLPAVSTCSGIWKRGTMRRPKPCRPAGFLRRAAACQNGCTGDDFRSMSRHGYF